jgi:hypothetical protein
MTRILRGLSASRPHSPNPISRRSSSGGNPPDPLNTGSPHSKKPGKPGQKHTHKRPVSTFPYPQILALVELHHLLSDLIESVFGIEHPIGLLAKFINIKDIELFGELSFTYVVYESFAHHLSPWVLSFKNLIRKLLK